MSMKSKVPAVTLAFWIIKICATTAGETGGDALSMSLGLGYAVSTFIFLGVLIALLAAQIRSKSYHPFLYWGVIVATTTTGTTISDYLDRTAGLGYPKSSLLLFCAVLAVLAAWRFTTGSVSVSAITARPAEIFYWTAILFSNTLGTALGDFVADSSGLGFDGGVLVFGAALVLIAAAYFFTKVSRAWLFWAAFVMTRPLGATLGDLLTKPHAEGGLEWSRIVSSLVIAAAIVLLVALTDRGAEQGTATIEPVT
jgi:uncharacterized membrane-anchored protein